MQSIQLLIIMVISFHISKIIPFHKGIGELRLLLCRPLDELVGPLTAISSAPFTIIPLYPVELEENERYIVGSSINGQSIIRQYLLPFLKIIPL